MKTSLRNSSPHNSNHRTAWRTTHMQLVATLSSSPRLVALSLGVGGAATFLVVRRMRRGACQMALVPYDEFSMFHENCAEHGIPYSGPPVVRRERVVLSDGRALSALVWGRGPPELVLLHGGAQNAHTWDTVSLALGRPLACIDLPSHGHSDSAAGGVNDPAAAAADVAQVMDALAPDAAAVVGMSFGGLTGIELSALRPDLVRRLVLIDVTPGVTRTKAKGVLDFVAKGPATFGSFDELLARTMHHNPTRSEASLRRGILHNAKQLPDSSWVWRHARFRGTERQARTPRQIDYSRLWSKLEAVAAPLMLVRGMRPQSMVDDTDEAEVVRRQPDCRVERVAEAGHSVQGDQPVALAELLTSFVDVR